MSLRYRLLYRLGITPWDGDRVPSELVELVEGPAALPPGRALDLGCGTGTQAVYLAREGWRVTGIDAVERPLAVARRRAARSGVSIDWVRADLAELPSLGLEAGFTLIHDRGCFHDLPGETRDAYARGVTSLAHSGATLLLMAFAPGRRVGAPNGASSEEISSSFGGGWELISAEPDSGPAPPGPMARVARTWYRLVRR